VNELLDSLLGADVAIRKALAREIPAGDVIPVIGRLTTALLVRSGAWPEAGDLNVRLHNLARDLRLALAAPGKRWVRRTLRRGLELLAPLVEPARRELECV
jgi:hypothetical protein